MFNRNSLRTVLLVVGSICIAAWIVEQLRREMPRVSVAIPLASTPLPEATSSQTPSPTLDRNSSPAVAMQSVAPITEPTVRRAELLPEKSVAPPRELPTFVRLKEPITFQPDPTKNRSTTLALPIGAKVRVVRVNGSWIWVEKGGNNTYIPITATDFYERMAGTTKDKP